MHLYEQHCLDKSSSQLLTQERVNQYLSEIQQWNISENQQNISRTFKLKNYKKTVQFVNAIATIADQENHHPDITFGYNTCNVIYSTHSAGGITLFDFICASQIDQVFSKKEFNV